jgi:hypothetical protein
VTPYSSSKYEAPILALILAACAVVALLYAQACTLHENPIGHRIDQPPVLVVTPSKPDDDGGAP